MDNLTLDPEKVRAAHGRRRLRRKISRIAAWLAAGSLVLAIVLAWMLERATGAVIDQAHQHARELAARAAKSIDEELRPIVPTVQAIADSLSSGTLGHDRLLDRLRDAAERSPRLAGLGVAYAPTAYDPALQLYAPYFVRRGEGFELTPLDSLYDYTDPAYAWYHGPMEVGATWVEPFSNDLTPGELVEYGVPFQASGGAGGPAGIVHATVALAEIDTLVASLDLGEEGYAFLVSKGGAVISHPLMRADDPTPFLGSPANVHREGVRALAERLRGETEEEIEDVVDPATGQPSWILLEQVPSTGWTVGVVFFRDQVAVHTTGFRRQQIVLLLVGLLTAFFAGVSVLARFRSLDTGSVWWAVTLVSTLAGVGVAAIWFTAYGAPQENTYDVVFASQASLQNFRLERTRRALRESADLPIYVPTGVFVQSLEFLSANNVSFSGYVWQRYPKDLPADFSRGFVLPEAVNTEITEAYRRTEGDEEVIGWLVRATLRESFDYSKYPLDQQAVWLRFWHPDIDRNVILVPDFSSYQLIHPLLRPGLEQDFVLPGWKIKKTFFAYRQNQYNATFGVHRPGGLRDLPELYFQVVATREILSPFFSNLLPVTVSALMVFALLLMVGPASAFGAIEVLATCAALFFVIILAQLDLRGSLGSERILYIEYFYFAMYGAILLVSLNAIMIGLGHRARVFEYRNNLIPKLLFWPLIQGTLLAVTVWVFF